MISLSYPSNEAWATQKKGENMACPRSMTQKKEEEKNGHNNVHEKKERRKKYIYSHVLMLSK
jgi:hypothetical protein